MKILFNLIILIIKAVKTDTDLDLFAFFFSKCNFQSIWYVPFEIVKTRSSICVTHCYDLL